MGEHIPHHLWEKYQSIWANGLSVPIPPSPREFSHLLDPFCFLKQHFCSRTCYGSHVPDAAHADPPHLCTVTSLFPTLPPRFPISHWELRPLPERHPFPSTDPTPAHLSGATPPGSLLTHSRLCKHSAICFAWRALLQAWPQLLSDLCEHTLAFKQGSWLLVTQVQVHLPRPGLSACHSFSSLAAHPVSAPPAQPVPGRTQHHREGSCLFPASSASGARLLGGDGPSHHSIVSFYFDGM